MNHNHLATGGMRFPPSTSPAYVDRLSGQADPKGLSALGQKRSFRPDPPNVRFAPKAVIRSTNENGGTMAAVLMLAMSVLIARRSVSLGSCGAGYCFSKTNTSE